jgi:hypothetical protein
LLIDVSYYRHLKATYLDGLPERPVSSLVFRVASREPKKATVVVPPSTPPKIKKYSVELDEIRLFHMEANKKRKVFPLYSQLKLSIGDQDFGTNRSNIFILSHISCELNGAIINNRQCQIKSVTDFEESFKFEIEDESLVYGSAVNNHS